MLPPDTAAPGGLTSIRLQNFKAHRDTTVPLGRLTVLVGPNGSGKTSVLEALCGLAAVVDAADRRFLLANLEAADVQHQASSEPIVTTATGELHGSPWQLSVQREKASGYKLEVSATSDGAPMNNASTTSDRERMAQAFGVTVLHQFDALKIAAGAAPEVSPSQVSPDGRNTAAVLSALKLDNDDRFERVQAALQRIVPSVERIRVRRVKGAQPNVVVEMILFDVRGATGLPAPLMSEGTLVTVALLTSICAASGRQLVLLDDIDHALHPTAQIELVRQMKRLLDEMPEVQIVATTHSPFILDELAPTEVCVFALRADGSVAMKRLSDHPDAGRAKGALSAGQIWTLDPEEKWVASAGA